MPINRSLVLLLAMFLFAGVAAHAGTSPVAKCKDAKAKAAGKEASALLRAIGKNISRSSDVRLGASISKAQSKFTSGFSKAEVQGACMINGDVSTIGAKVEAFVFQAVEAHGATCGNGIAGGAEECDAGNGDGHGPSPDCDSGICNAGCVCTTCGDGNVVAPEQCDDGLLNGTPASCCAIDCTFQPTGTGCTDDGNTCTDDKCDGAGTCAHPNNAAPCDDGVFCNGADTCDAGACGVHAGDPCPGTECNSCQEGTDTCFDPAGAGCTNDGLFCTGVETCDGGGVCTSSGDPCAGGPECNVTCNEPTDDCFDPAGTGCTDDGNACTDDKCDGAGTCAHPSLSDGSTPVGCDNVVGCSSDSCQGGVCTPTSSCCTGLGQLFSFESGVPGGTCGVVRSFRCSNYLVASCVDDADCDFGYCVTMFGICTGDTSISCTTDADCVGTCGERIGAGLPLDLACGGAYTGGGKNSIPLPWVIPDMVKTVFGVAACNAATGQMTLGPATATDLAGMPNPERHCTEGRRCSGTGTPCVADSDCPASNTCETNCLLGPPLPVPNTTPGSEATSFCAVNVVVEDGAGTAQCDGGTTDLSLPMSTLVYLNGDLLSRVGGPVAVPGIQPCPLCTRVCSDTRAPCESDAACKACVGGTNAGEYCVDGSDCDSATCASLTGTCGGATECLGGPGDGDTCIPETSAASVLGRSFPTSHDCGPGPGPLIKGIGAKNSLSFNLTTGAVELPAKDMNNQRRTFCGFCRDDTTTGGLCFEGDPNTGCPLAGSGIPVPCTDDSGCSTPPYESCEQRNPGAFTRAAATRISVAGSTAGECLGDGTPHAASLASIFCISPSFNSLVDGAGDFPGPGAAMIEGIVRLLP